MRRSQRTPFVDHMPGRACVGTKYVPSPSWASGCGGTVTVVVMVAVTVAVIVACSDEAVCADDELVVDDGVVTAAGGLGLGLGEALL